LYYFIGAKNGHTSVGNNLLEHQVQFCTCSDLLPASLSWNIFEVRRGELKNHITNFVLLLKSNSALWNEFREFLSGWVLSGPPSM